MYVQFLVGVVVRTITRFYCAAILLITTRDNELRCFFTLSPKRGKKSIYQVVLDR